jgi:hypothetical protein
MSVLDSTFIKEACVFIWFFGLSEFLQKISLCVLTSKRDSAYWHNQMTGHQKFWSTVTPAINASYI